MADRVARAATNARSHDPGPAHGSSCRQGCPPELRNEVAAPFDTNALISARGLSVARNGRDLLEYVLAKLGEAQVLLGERLVGPLDGLGQTAIALGPGSRNNVLSRALSHHSVPSVSISATLYQTTFRA